MGIKFEGSSFTNCGGVISNGTEVPINHGNGNISWPKSWSKEQRAKWRQDNNVPGHEWRGPESKKP